MTDRISIDFAVAEGAAVRLLGLVERRGYRVSGIGMTEHDDGETASMVLEVEARDAGRRIDVLDLQIRRLVGVRNVSFYSTPMASAA